MRTKICGITNLRDAKLAIESHAWALGFNFYSHSPRFLQLAQAQDIIQALPKEIIKVGLFVDQDYKDIQHIMKDLRLDLAQVYQDYDCLPDAKRSMIFVIQPSSEEEVPALNILSQYGYVLIDAPRGKNDLYGGTGKLANWDIAKNLGKHVKLLLAGGLNYTNVKSAIQTVQPYGIDVCSSIESSPGIKDPIRLQQFLNETSYE